MVPQLGFGPASLCSPETSSGAKTTGGINSMESLDMTTLSWRGKEFNTGSAATMGSAPKTRTQLGLGKGESTNLLHTHPPHLGTAHPCLGLHPSGEKILCIWRPTNSCDCLGGIDIFGKIPRTGQTSIGDTDCGCTRSLSPDTESLRIVLRREGISSHKGHSWEGAECPSLEVAEDRGTLG